MPSSKKATLEHWTIFKVNRDSLIRQIDIYLRKIKYNIDPDHKKLYKIVAGCTSSSFQSFLIDKINVRKDELTTINDVKYFFRFVGVESMKEDILKKIFSKINNKPVLTYTDFNNYWVNILNYEDVMVRHFADLMAALDDVVRTLGPQALAVHERYTAEMNSDEVSPETQLVKYYLELRETVYTELIEKPRELREESQRRDAAYGAHSIIDSMSSFDTISRDEIATPSEFSHDECDSDT